MSMTYADHVYDNHWEEAADENGVIDYEKLCRIYHKHFEEYQRSKDALCSSLRNRLEEQIDNNLFYLAENKRLKEQLEKAENIIKKNMGSTLDEIIEWRKKGGE